MAIAPVNKFISIMVPVAPGLQKLYEVPTGTAIDKNLFTGAIAILSQR